MVSTIKKRGFLSRLFFQDPVEAKDAKYPPQSNNFPISASGSDAHAKWVKLSTYTDGKQTQMEMTTFPFVIGREMTQLGITLDDKSASARHASMDFQNNLLTITDLQSRNGVKLGEAKISPNVAAPVTRGAVISIGRTEIIVTDFSGADAPAIDSSALGETEFLNQTVFLEQEMEVKAVTTSESSSLLTLKATIDDSMQMVSNPTAASVSEVTKSEPSVMETAENACDKCGYKNNKQSKFCAGCGIPTSQPIVIPTTKPMRFCNSCGVKNVDMQNFCVNCGQKLTSV